MKRIYLWKNERIQVFLLREYLSLSLQAGLGNTMDPALMQPEAARACRWLHYGIGKGITSPNMNVSVFGVPEQSYSGLHGELVKGFPNTDPTPLCYDELHINGFGDFVRWVFFADLAGKQNFCGIDFSLVLRSTSGVATSFFTVWQVVSTLIEHGLPPETEVVLLNSRMCEYEYMQAVREAAGLITAADWTAVGAELFSQQSAFCPRCGQKTLEDETARFCSQCGCAVGTLNQNKAKVLYVEA